MPRVGNGMEIEIDVATTHASGSFDDAFRDLYPVVARTAGFVARDRQLGADIAQEAFVRLFERWDGIESDEHARNFVLRVAVNLAKSHLRRRLAAPFGLHGPDRVVGDPSERSDAWLELADALGRLTPIQRACVVLVDYADLDSPSAGKVLGIADATVRVHLHRARRTLRAALSLPQEDDR
jgi:RNA polymerase sigma factor (sigma-70 family)